MYAPPVTYRHLVRDLAVVIGGENSKESEKKARLLVHVELTLFLAERLGLESEPLTVGWVLLSRMPLYHPQLKRLTPEQRRMRANASVIVPLSARYAWENVLVRYSNEKEFPARLRLYAVAPTGLDEQMINVCRQEPCPDPQRVERYEMMLTEQLPFEQRTRRYTKDDQTYKVRVKAMDGEYHVGRVKITEEMQQLLDKDVVWLEPKPDRNALTISLDDLLPTAQFLDAYERRVGERIHWEHDLRQIRFQRINRADDRISLDDVNTSPLVLDGAVHLPGMVSAGKTTLAKLIIAHCIRLGLNTRITLVVGDTNSAVEIAHQFNSWFCESLDDEVAAAVPLLGVSQREIHLGRLLTSRHYQKCLKKGQPHWGERWLMPICPLAAYIKWEGSDDVQIPAGSEPCQSLIDEPTKPKVRGNRHVCPLFHVCPSKQMYRDMPQAQLWVTTPGALAQATMPLHLDERIITLGDLVYEQSDLVILDEVETIVDWYDRTFARREELTNGQNGLLDRLDTQISAYWNTNRVLPPTERRWLITARESLKALSGVLTALATPEQDRIAKNWVKRGYFAPNQLAYRLARRLAGLKEWDAADISPDERRENEVQTQRAFKAFDEILNLPPDPLRSGENVTRTPIANELAQLMQAMNNLADDVSDADLLRQHQDWVRKHYPELEGKLKKLYSELSQSSDSFDHEYAEKYLDRSINEIAKRLQFMLLVALLDRHLHIVIHEWFNKPESLDAQQPFSAIPRGAQAILPLPLTGKQYGFVAHSGHIKYSRDAANRLELFSYTNIGRSYLLNFHRLRHDFDGQSGPHVLALSGTSYLPDSTTFHVNLPPSGILLPPHQTEQAIKDSRFIWRSFTDLRGKPIKVSGDPDKNAKLRQLVHAMLRDGGVPGGFFGKVLTWLDTQSEQNPEQWKDRSRLLLLTNSYTQSKVVAESLREGWRAAAEGVFDLKQAKGRSKDEDYQIESGRGNQLHRIDIEQFASYPKGRILVAPMQSIGRGFNILNGDSKAAFGAVFFLTRPMNVPNDREAIAQELNRYALSWADDAQFSAWGEDTLYRRALKAREYAVELTRDIERRRSYRELEDNAELGTYPRRDLAATTAGRVVQAVGRLLRGGVPFRAFFVDAAWSPDLAKTGDIDRIEPAETSLLTAMIEVMDDYTLGNAIGQRLYGDLSDALTATENRDNN